MQATVYLKFRPKMFEITRCDKIRGCYSFTKRKLELKSSVGSAEASVLHGRCDLRTRSLIFRRRAYLYQNLKAIKWTRPVDLGFDSETLRALKKLKQIQLMYISMVGRVLSIVYGRVAINGLPSVKYGELILIETTVGNEFKRALILNSTPRIVEGTLSGSAEVVVVAALLFERVRSNNEGENQNNERTK